MGKGKGRTIGKGNFPFLAPIEKKVGERNQVEKNRGGERNQVAWNFISLFFPARLLMFLEEAGISMIIQ